MAIEIKVPPLGESLVDAVVGTWLKGEGDAINRGETILELETDKVNLEVTAEDDGVLGAIQRQEGDTVTVGEVLGTLEPGDGAPLADNPEAAADPAGVSGSTVEKTTEPESTDAPGGPPAAQSVA
jgi:2-oxoglutarate dehydrogenase E2 component (dihydrolipoamide succinyltransferase)